MKNVRRLLSIILILSIILVPTIASANSNDFTVKSKVALLHFNPELGNVGYNVNKLKELTHEALENGANIVVTPEFSTTGYCITKQQSLDGLGFRYPYPELDEIRDLAIAYKAYVIIAIVEISSDSKVYNTVVTFGPQGLIRTQDKRSIPLWHESGKIPFDIIPTPYGDLGTLICADTYSPDWTRILALKGADIILTPANWWGRDNQEQTWQIRAKENGVWLLVANRWGYEYDTQYGYECYMNDAPSVAINPDGNILQLHRAEDDLEPKDTILYQDVTVPKYRIGTKTNLTYSVMERAPSAYTGIDSGYYGKNAGYPQVPGLPAPGDIKIASLAYKPSFSGQKNISTIQSLWAQRTADVVVLPGLGITNEPINSDNTGWNTASPWSALQNFVESNSISLLVTTVNERTGNDFHQSLLLIEPGKAPRLIPQIHDGLNFKGSGNSPVVLDLLSARIGILTGHDALFPETVTSLAKSGIDLLIISSTAGTGINYNNILNINYLWDINSLKTLWKVRTNETFHLAASDWTGNGMLIKNSGYIEDLKETTDTNPVEVMTVNTGSVRNKYLNDYYQYDISTLTAPNTNLENNILPLIPSCKSATP